jgi:hypothetical protein
VEEIAKEIRHSIQFGWDGQSREELLELCGRFLDQSVTEQVLYPRGEQPEKLAEKVADDLPEMRELERVRA